MKTAWHTLKQWLAQQSELEKFELNPPATQADLLALETDLQIELPQSFKDFLLCHNGQSGHMGIIDGMTLFSVSQMLECSQDWMQFLEDEKEWLAEAAAEGDGERHEGVCHEIQDVWWSKKWLPFAIDAGGNVICLDFEPTDVGHYGQVIQMWHDDFDRAFIAPSFEAYFKDYVARIMAGEYVVTPWNDGLIKKEEWDEVFASKQD